MPSAKKLPSGSWRVQVFDYKDSNGKNHYKSFTAPTKKEAEFMASSFSLTKKQEKDIDITLQDAMKNYIELKKGVLSSSTLVSYDRLIVQYPDSLLNTKLANIKKIQIDNFIKDYSSNHSPKSVANAYGFMSTTCKYFGYPLGEHALPQKKPCEYIVPTDADIKTLLDYTREKDNELYKAVLLGAYGCMRRSEICGASASDINKGVLHIHTAKVKDFDGTYTEKTTKTVSSDRYIELPDFLLQEMPTQGKLVNVTPDALTRRFEVARESLGLPAFRFHDLRHYCASVMHANGIPDVYIMNYGGWSSDKVLKQVYRNTMSDYEKTYNEVRKNLFEKNFKG